MCVLEPVLCFNHLCDPVARCIPAGEKGWQGTERGGGEGGGAEVEGNEGEIFRGKGLWAQGDGRAELERGQMEGERIVWTGRWEGQK